MSCEIFFFSILCWKIMYFAIYNSRYACSVVLKRFQNYLVVLFLITGTFVLARPNILSKCISIDVVDTKLEFMAHMKFCKCFMYYHVHMCVWAICTLSLALKCQHALFLQHFGALLRVARKCCFVTVA